VKLLNEIKSTFGRTYSIANFTANFHLTKDLDLVTQLGGQTESTYDFYYAGKDVLGVSQSVSGRARRRHDNIGRWTNENYLAYKHDFGKHNLQLTAGASWYYQRSTMTSVQTENFFDDYYTYNNIGAGATVIPPQSLYRQEQTMSYYGRLQYNYDSRYLFTASYRNDGASQPAIGQKRGNFPSFSVGWNLHNESFYKESSLADVISTVKFRGSWGVTGNALLPAYASWQLVGSQSSPFGVVTTPISLGNNVLAWEEAVQTNIGADLSLLNNRINITFDWYNKVNRNLLLLKELTAESGYPNAYQNIGKIRNRGIEIGVTTVNIDNKDLRWTTSANFTMNRSKVLKLNGAPIFGTWAGWIAEGRPLNEFYGYVRQGVWSEAEKAQAESYGREPGDTKWQDTNGNGVKDIDDRVPLGNAMPSWEASINNRISYKGFSFLLDVGGMKGLSLINTARHLMQNSATSVNSFGDILNAWTPDNQNTIIPAVRTAQDRGNPSEVADSYAVEDASFIRVRNIGLSYTTRVPWLQKLLLKSLTIGANVENAFLWTKYSGFDPEYSSLDAKLDQGVDIYQYPKPRVISFTLNATF
ncbi:MAG: SusC/RagA family TonB-linked outer membrane protein, partial [Sphingobacteriaceae bacterium]